MTTIAVSGRTMAGDGQREHCGTITTRNAEKVRRLSDGSIVGTAGDTAVGMAFVEWLEKGGEAPKLEPESGFTALRLMPDGALLMYDKHCVAMPVETPFAIGSGMDLAIGAMLAGKSPAEAIDIAAFRDPGTGGTVIIASLDTKGAIGLRAA